VIPASQKGSPKASSSLLAHTAAWQCRSETHQDGLLVDKVANLKGSVGVASECIGHEVTHPLLKTLQLTAPRTEPALGKLTC
jgi:hypothetical protein